MTMEKTLRTDMVHSSASEEVLLNCISSDMVSSGERESLIWDSVQEILVKRLFHEQRWFKVLIFILPVILKFLSQPKNLKVSNDLSSPPSILYGFSDVIFCTIAATFCAGKRFTIRLPLGREGSWPHVCSVSPLPSPHSTPPPRFGRYSRDWVEQRIHSPCLGFSSLFWFFFSSMKKHNHSIPDLYSDCTFSWGHQPMFLEKSVFKVTSHFITLSKLAGTQTPGLLLLHLC